MLSQEDDSFRLIDPSLLAHRQNKGKAAAMSTGAGTTATPQLSPPIQGPIPRIGLPGGIANMVEPSTRPMATPPRRRSGAPSSIPNFPSASEHRDSSSSTGFSPSPSVSPGPSPFKSPPTPSTPPNHAPFRLPMTQPFANPGGPSSGPMPSPWHNLAMSSGAPTPSLDGPGRSSPHLGGPFEQLNLNGSWSAGNLWAGDFDKSAEPAYTSPSRAGSGGDVGMNQEMLAKYRNMAGRASATGGSRRSPKVDSENAGGKGSAMEGIEVPAPTMPNGQKLSLPAALARRRASLPKVGLGVLSPPTQHATKSPSPLAASMEFSNSTSPPPGLNPLSASDLPKLLSRGSTLVLDVRPPSAYLAGHMASAHSIPVPSTLLRRPAFTVAKVILMLSLSSRDAVQAWKEKSNIVLVDVDSTSAGQGSLLEGLASKFEREGFGGRVWFVKGGQNALVADHQVDMVTSSPADGADESAPSGPGPMSPSGNFSAGGLGSFAFLHGSTGSGVPASRSGGGFPFTPSVNRSNPFDSLQPKPAGDRPLSLRGMMLGDSGPCRSPSAGSHSSSSSGKLKPKMQPANPFFDNIRQNLELSHGGIIERIPLQLPPDARRRAHELPAWLSELVTLSDKEAAEKLAQQFYTLERNEQLRLQALMDWHSKSSGGVLPVTTQDDLGEKGKESSWAQQKKRDQSDVERLELWRAGQQSPDPRGEEYYPFSITAGVERGTKNRYKNIWPYDFSRVRLVSPCEDQSDYINASYIQPRGTSRRYIATQGPLDATFRDFWTLVWEQDVRVIVMLTKQFEGGLVKCGNYWQDQHYGALHLHLESQVGGEDAGQPAQTTGFDFGMPSQPTLSSQPQPGQDDQPHNIRRDFYLSHSDHPNDPPRKIVQIQCVTWPDFDVPESPDVLLALIKDVDEALREVSPECRNGGKEQDKQPVLVHCSAGIGRTGSFIVVDSILDALTREHHAARAASEDMPMAPAEEEEKVHHIPALPESSPPPTAAEGMKGGRHSREGSGSSGADPSSAGPGLGFAAGSGDSGRSRRSGRGKSVSFAGDEIITSLAKAKNPSKEITKDQGGFSWTTTDQTKANEGGMEVDSPFEYQSPPPTADNHWTAYRDDKTDHGSDSGTNDVGRRPSLASAYTSDDKLSSEKLSTVTEEVRSVATGRGNRQRSPTPLADMENPVLEVLESMRVQRMSLVQSLRQFVFAYKVIIHQYFAMLDEDADKDREAGKTVNISQPSPMKVTDTPFPPITTSSSNLTTSTTNSGGTSATGTTAPTSIFTDDVYSMGSAEEDHLKRRASPTELVHDRPSLEFELRKPRVEGALGRKASVKRMKQDVRAKGSAGEGSPKL